MCSTNSVDSGNNTDWAFVTTYTQNDWRWYVDSDANNVSDPWGNPDLDENETMDVTPVGDDAIEDTEEIRARVNITVDTCDLAADTVAFKLQYGSGADCTAVSSWTDVDAGGGGGIWRYATSSVSDGATLSSTVLSASDVAGKYVKSTSAGNNPNSVTTSQDMEWDFHLQDNSATTATSYCYRIVESDGTVLDTYSSYPRLETWPDTADVMRSGNVFVSGVEKGFTFAD